MSSVVEAPQRLVALQSTWARHGPHYREARDGNPSVRMPSQSNFGRPETSFRGSESQRFEADRNLSCFRSEMMFGKKRLVELTFRPPAPSVNAMAADLLLTGT